MQDGNTRKLQRYFYLDYKRDPEMFSAKAQKIIRVTLLSKSEKNASRWKDFDTVIDRLNAPQLVDYYERARFRYVIWESLPQPVVSPRYVFKYNKGECVSITRFTVLCLRRGGYKAREYRGRSIIGRSTFHASCLFEMNGKKYIMDNGQPRGSGIVPWDSYKYK